MATSEERGFSFKDLPTVIDPAVETIEVKLVPYLAPGADLRDEDVVFAVYHKVVFAAEALPVTQDLDFANIYCDDPDADRASRAFAYGANGVLRAILYRDGPPHRHWPLGWLMERMPEEFTGEHVPRPSVRFMFTDLEAARAVAELAGRLQVAIATHASYPDMQADAQRLINLVVGRGSEPRLVEVADPLQRRQF